MIRLFRYWLSQGFLLMGLVLAPACTTTKTVRVPGPPVTVKVPVPVACQIEQVPEGQHPAAQARKGMGIFDLTKIALADRQAKAAEIERLRAANTSPCPVK